LVSPSIAQPDISHGQSNLLGESTGKLQHWLGEVTRSDHLERQNSDCKPGLASMRALVYFLNCSSNTSW
jgi:hypothetical protein